jgi:hypothetical protein
VTAAVPRGDATGAGPALGSARSPARPRPSLRQSTAVEHLDRYERERPGELIHIDVKKLGRIQGGAGDRVTRRRRYNRP